MAGRRRGGPGPIPRGTRTPEPPRRPGRSLERCSRPSRRARGVAKGTGTSEATCLHEWADRGASGAVLKHQRWHRCASCPMPRCRSSVAVPFIGKSNRGRRSLNLYRALLRVPPLDGRAATPWRCHHHFVSAPAFGGTSDRAGRSTFHPSSASTAAALSGASRTAEPSCRSRHRSRPASTTDCHPL